MASVTLTSDRFPAGTSVGAFPRTNWPASVHNPSGAPVGAATETKTVAANGTLAFTALAETDYWAYAQVSGEHRYVAFAARQAPESLITLDARLDAVELGDLPEFAAKGDLLVATADNTGQRRAVGANATVLTADSAEVDGVKWAPPAAPSAHAAAHADGGTDEITGALDPRAYPMLSGTLAARPAFGVAGRFYWTDDEGILYRDSGTAWVKVAVRDYPDLDGIPATFAPSAHGHVIADTTGLQGALDGKAATTDARFPAGADVVDADVGAAAAIAESKLALASDAAAATASRRTLGTGATQAAAGNDARLSDTRTPTDDSVTRVKIAAATLKHARVSTGSIAGGATATITCNWAGGAFPNTSYTASAVVQEDSTGNDTLQVLKFINRLAGSIQVVVRNNDAINAKTGTVHAIGIGD